MKEGKEGKAEKAAKKDVGPGPQPVEDYAKEEGLVKPRDCQEAHFTCAVPKALPSLHLRQGVPLGSFRSGAKGRVCSSARWTTRPRRSAPALSISSENRGLLSCHTLHALLSTIIFTRVATT